MKRRILLVFITIPYILIGQSIFSGKVIDENKNPVPFCNILLVSPTGDENFILTLNGTNLLNTMRFRPFFDIPDLNIIQSADILFLKPQAKITITYNFGNRNVKSKKIESTEESQRIKTGSD